MEKELAHYWNRALRLPGHVVRRLLRYRAANELVLTKDLRETRQLDFQSGLEIREVENEDRATLAAFHDEHDVETSQRDRIQSYLAHGHNGWLAFVDGELVGYLWWTDSSFDYTNCHPHLRVYGIELGERDAYMVDFYIAPDRRGSGRAMEFFNRAQQDLGSRGYERAYGLVAVQKVAAKWVYTSLGWRIVREQRGHVFFNTLGFSNGQVFSARRCKF